MKKPMKKVVKKALLSLVFLAFTGGLIWLHLLNRAESEQEQEAPIGDSSKLLARKGAPPILELSHEALDAAAIKTTPLVSSRIKGRIKDGVEMQLPVNAIIRDQGRTWVYFRLSDTQFAREEVEPVSDLETGPWRLKGVLSQSPALVTQGAQILLSEELKSEIQVGEGG